MTVTIVANACLTRGFASNAPYVIGQAAYFYLAYNLNPVVTPLLNGMI